MCTRGLVPALLRLTAGGCVSNSKYLRSTNLANRYSWLACLLQYDDSVSVDFYRESESQMIRSGLKGGKSLRTKVPGSSNKFRSKVCCGDTMEVAQQSLACKKSTRVEMGLGTSKEVLK